MTIVKAVTDVAGAAADHSPIPHRVDVPGDSFIAEFATSSHRINDNDGRDHHNKAFTCLLGRAGIVGWGGLTGTLAGWDTHSNNFEGTLPQAQVHGMIALLAALHAMGLATLRPEGFVSVDSTVRPGLLLTRPFVSDGSRLRVNVQCEPKGNLEVELTDADDQVIPGYERSACDTFTGDAPRHAVTWRGKSQLPRAVLAKGAKLRFFSYHASFYAFQTVDVND